MSFSKYAGVAIVPTLARIVLAAVFIPAGWNKVFEKAEFTVEEATQLRALGIVPDPIVPPKVTMNIGAAEWMNENGSQAFDEQSAVVVLARYSPQNPPADGATGTLPEGQSPPPPASDGKPQATPGASAPNATAPDAGVGGVGGPTIINPAPVPTLPPLAPGMYSAQALHKLTLMLEQNHFPYAVWQARLAAFTELIGGAMLLLGLFSRIWGLGLSIAMGVAFYLVSMKMNGIFTMDPRVFAQEPMRSSIAFLQLALFVLAFGVLLTGAGPLSLDRMLFGSGDNVDPGDVKID